MGIADFGVGAQQGLQQMIAQRLQREAVAEQQRANLEREAQARAELEQRRAYQTESLAGLRDQREANADLRRQNAAHRLVQDLAPGDVLDPTAAETLRGGNLGALVDRQEATLPSRQMGGFLRTGKTAPTGGFIRSVTREGNPERDLFRGTPAQRKAQQQQDELRRLVDSLPEGPEKTALRFQLATGGDNPPAALLPRQPTSRYSLHTTYDETGSPTGAVRFNAITGEAEPVDVGGSLRAPGRGQLPMRVQNYLLQLRSQHPQFEDAQAELSRVLANAPGETFDRIAASNQLRQLYSQPSGFDPFEQFVRQLGITGGSPSGTPASQDTPPSGAAAAPYQPGQRVTLRDGRTVTITRVLPDGTFEIE